MELLYYLRDIVQTPVFYILIAVIFIDLIVGILTGVFLNSKKTENGAIESRYIIKGIVKKVGIILLFIFCAILDFFLNENYILTFVTTFIIGAEGFSILENLALCGIPIPDKLKSIIEVLKKGDKTK